MDDITFLTRIRDDRVNLSELSRKTGVEIRILRRARSGGYCPRQATIDKCAPFLRKLPEAK